MYLTEQEFKAAGVESIDDLVVYIANVWNDGCVQGIFNETQLENGAHYEEARQVLTERVVLSIIPEFLVWDMKT